MSDILRAPINYGVAADGQFVKGGSVVFGFENIRPDADNPATLKAIFLDDGLTLQATNPQGLSSDATFNQADNGVLFGDTGAKYSIIIYDANDVELSYIPSYDLSDSSASITAQDAANDASASAVAAALSEVAAGLSEANTLALYTDFVNRYFGAFASDPALDAEGNPPVDGSLYWNTVNKTFKAYDSGVWYLPQDLGFGTAAYANIGLATGQLPTADDLSMVGETVNYTGANLNPNEFGGVAGGRQLGVAANASVAIFEFLTPLPSIVASITVGSTFSITKVDGSAVTGGSGVTPLLAGSSMLGVTEVYVAGLSGITTEQPLFIVCDSNASLITVNT